MGYFRSANNYEKGPNNLEENTVEWIKELIPVLNMIFSYILVSLSGTA